MVADDDEFHFAALPQTEALPKRLWNRNLALARHRGDFHKRLLVIPGKNTIFMGSAEAGS